MLSIAEEKKNSEYSVFNFNSNEVRVASSDPLNPYFVASDVAKALGYKKERNAIARHCKRQVTAPKQGGGNLTLIPESDLYRLVFRSKLKAAEDFTDWVVEDVLPQIRKTGSYSVPARNPYLALTDAMKQICGSNSKLYPKYYRKLYCRYQVTSYKDIPVELVDDAIRYLESISGDSVVSKEKEAAELMQFTAERIALFRDLENQLNDVTEKIVGLNERWGKARYQTTDLTFHLKHSAKQLAKEI